MKGIARKKVLILPKGQPLMLTIVNIRSRLAQDRRSLRINIPDRTHLRLLIYFLKFQ